MLFENALGTCFLSVWASFLYLVRKQLVPRSLRSYHVPARSLKPKPQTSRPQKTLENLLTRQISIVLPLPPQKTSLPSSARDSSRLEEGSKVL